MTIYLDDNRLIIEDLFVGRVISVTARQALVRLNDAHEAYGIHYNGFTYGAGEVGELLVFEGRSNLVVGQTTSVYEELCEKPRETRRVAIVSLLATACIDSGKLKIGVTGFPRITARVFCVPVGYLKNLHKHTCDENRDFNSSVFVKLGTLQAFHNIPFLFPLTKLMNLHCGIFGATGGGKSWTAAKLIEEISQCKTAKFIILDPTGEYESVIKKENIDNILKLFIGKNLSGEPNHLEPSTYLSYDFFTDETLELLINPNDDEKKYLRKAITEFKSQLQKQDRSVVSLTKILNDHFSVSPRKNDVSFIYSELLRKTRLFDEVTKHLIYTKEIQNKSNIDKLESELLKFSNPNSKFRFLYVSLKNISSELGLKDISVHLIANFIYKEQKSIASGSSRESQSIILLLDEAHNFISPQLNYLNKELNAFEKIAREGRKIGLNLCLITQCPKDLPEVVLNQLGTVIVHRLSGDHDRKLMERSCGDIDVSALSSLPILGTGQAVVLGTNFPIPVVVNVDKPENPPKLN